MLEGIESFATLLESEIATILKEVLARIDLNLFFTTTPNPTIPTLTIQFL